MSMLKSYPVLINRRYIPFNIYNKGNSMVQLKLWYLDFIEKDISETIPFERFLEPNSKLQRTILYNKSRFFKYTQTEDALMGHGYKIVYDRLKPAMLPSRKKQFQFKIYQEGSFILNALQRSAKNYRRITSLTAFATLLKTSINKYKYLNMYNKYNFENINLFNINDLHFSLRFLKSYRCANPYNYSENYILNDVAGIKRFNDLYKRRMAIFKKFISNKNDRNAFFKY